MRQALVLGVIKIGIMLNLLIGSYVLGQSLSEPLVLKNGDSFLKPIRLTDRPSPNTFTIVTLKFCLTANGILDTLYISNNATEGFTTSMRQQLTALNGKWKIPIRPKDKWVIMHFYLGGYKEDSTNCLDVIEKEFTESYKREAGLFQCTTDLFSPVRCTTSYLEGADYILLPPWLSREER